MDIFADPWATQESDLLLGMKLLTDLMIEVRGTVLWITLNHLSNISIDETELICSQYERNALQKAF